MAWEQRKSAKYFYASRRLGRRVRKLYFGRGPHAEVAAAALDAARQQRRQAAAAAREEQAKFQEIDHLLADFHGQSGDWLAPALIAQGFHQHDRGQWRRRKCH
jgi:hypothetical protein